MSKLARTLCLLIATLLIIVCASFIADRHQLNEQIVRLHVVAQSDSQLDQSVKLQVRDAIMQELQGNMNDVKDQSEAINYLRENLQHLENVANKVLEMRDVNYKARVTLRKEAFDIRHYDTFSLPAGVYQSLRIELGKAEGKNWWCVVFPSLCMQASSDGDDVSVFLDTLTNTIEHKQGYEIRFFILDWLGNLEKLFFNVE